MKTLKESLFDSDVAEKRIPEHQLKDLVMFDGQIVRRLNKESQSFIGFKDPHALEVIDWKKVKQDLKKYDWESVDLGQYPYFNADKEKIRTGDVVKKTEQFAKLILSLPFVEECNLDSYNSRFCEEFEKKLDKYIVERWKGHNGFYFAVDTNRLEVIVSLYYNVRGNAPLVKWEFLKI